MKGREKVKGIHRADMGHSLLNLLWESMKSAQVSGGSLSRKEGQEKTFWTRSGPVNPASPTGKEQIREGGTPRETNGKKKRVEKEPTVTELLKRGG